MAAASRDTGFSHFPNNTNPKWWRDAGLRMNVFHCAGLYFCVFYLGYDAALLNGLQAMPQWQTYFNNPTSSFLGLISASLFLPAIVTPYMSSIVNDRWGRKVALGVGSVLLVIGAIVNALSKSRGIFILGRVLIGAAGGFGKITAVALLQEIAHPRLRPILATSFYSNYYFGSIVAAWFCFGSLKWGDTTWAWRAPCLFQVVAPAIVFAFLFIVPESPRWLVHHDRNEEALNILAKYHANGDLHDELVRYEYDEICVAIRLEEENKQTRYIDFLKTPGNRRRLLVLFTMATGTNWIGNSIISYYLTPVLKLVGITDPTKISGINGGLAVWNLLLSYSGSLNAERVGRRKLWLASTIGMLVSYIILTGLSGNFAQTKNSSVGIAVVPMLFIYYGFYDIGWTPLPFSYGSEILPYHMRLKGLSILLSTQNIAQTFNQWVNPVALNALAWKYYIIYICLIVVYLVLIIFFFPETRRLTVEEVSVLFDTGRLGDATAAKAELQQDNPANKAVSILVEEKNEVPSHDEHKAAAV